MGASWIASKDKVFYRRAGFTLKFAIPKAERAKLGGRSGGTVVAEVGEPQRISAPTQLGSFSDFELALDAIGDAQEASSGR